jgi:hypothetical protein
VDATGGSVTIDVITAPECAWTVSKDAAWVTGVTPSSGQGNGTVAIQVLANADSVTRSTDVRINDTRASVRQDAAPCLFAVEPAALSVDAGGALTSVAVTTLASCTWTSDSSVSWITLTGEPSGVGPATVGVSIAANTGGARTGTLTIGGRPVSVSQSSIGGAGPGGNQPVACTYGISPLSQSIGATGGNGGPITVTTTSGCPWTAVSSVSWLMIATGASGAGPAAMTFTVAANSGPQRSGTLTIAGQVFSVTQANGCVYAVAPNSRTVDHHAGSGAPFSVTTAAGCPWVAQSNNSWITITSGATGSGTGSVGFSVTKGPNQGRTGSLTIAGTTVTVIQEEK